VQEQPHAVALVQAHFDEVVAGAQRAELQPPLRCDRIGLVDPVQHFEFRNACLRARQHPLVVAPCGKRNRGRDRAVQVGEMPQPMSTPTAAGMIAPTVGITLPTVAPLPRCASGINARCGRTNGMDAVRWAWARVWSSRIDAKFASLLDTLTIVRR
jgi:hypothetical protein